jgi:hypothetical protein
MTVSTTHSENSFVGNGVQTSFDWTFQVLLFALGIDVYLDNELQTTGFSLYPNEDQYTTPGGTLVFDVAPADGALIEVRRNTGKEQNVDFPLEAKLSTVSLETAFDKQMLIAQENAREIGRKTFVWRGQWVSTTNYAVGEAVFHEGSSYLANAANVNSEPPSANWDLIAQQGATGSIGAEAQGEGYVLTDGGPGLQPSYQVPRASVFNCRIYTESNDPTKSVDGERSTLFVGPYLGEWVSLPDANGENFVPIKLSQLAVPIPNIPYCPFDIYLFRNGNSVGVEIVKWEAIQTTGTITGATAANPCVLTAINGLAVDDLIAIDGITGTLGTAAKNGLNTKVHAVQAATGTTITLSESTDTTGLTYTAGGNFYKIPANRAIALTSKAGVWLKSTNLSRLYVGSAMTLSASKVSRDRYRNLVWNFFNRLPQLLYAKQTGTTWTTTSTSSRCRNNSTAFGPTDGARVERFVGIISEDYTVNMNCSFKHSTANAFWAMGVTINTTSTATGYEAVAALYSGAADQYNSGVLDRPIKPVLGYQFLQAIEQSFAAGTGTFNANNVCILSALVSG